jgi:hypothetical protein
MIPAVKETFPDWSGYSRWMFKVSLVRIGEFIAYCFRLVAFRIHQFHANTCTFPTTPHFLQRQTMSQLPQDTIQILSSNSSRRRVKRYKIIFITGNPGLINYYEKFLTHLHALLSSSKANAEFTVCGSSLIGFEVGDGKKAWKSAGVAHDAPFNLAEVIDAAEKNVVRCIEDDSDCGVVLVGHSVGAFITLEIIQRHRRRLEAGNKKGKEPRIVGGICLFPTVVDIGKSERGVVLTVSLVFFHALFSFLYSHAFILRRQLDVENETRSELIAQTNRKSPKYLSSLQCFHS